MVARQLEGVEHARGAPGGHRAAPGGRTFACRSRVAALPAGPRAAAPASLRLAALGRLRSVERRCHPDNRWQGGKPGQAGGRRGTVQLEVQRTLGPRDVLGQFDLGDPAERALAQQLPDRLEHRAGPGQQLSRAHRIAEVMGSLPEEADVVPAHVKARPHAVTSLGGRRHHDGLLPRDPSDSRQRVDDHFALEEQLPRIGDMGVDVPAARPVRHARPAVRARLQHLHGHAVRDTLPCPLDERAHPLPGQGGAHEHDKPLVAGDHPPARCGFLDDEIDDGAWGEHAYLVVASGWWLVASRHDVTPKAA